MSQTPSIIPNEAIDQCENSYEAADGKKQKAAMDGFDDTEHLFSLLPTNTTVIALYNVGCVLSRSLSQYDILDTSVTSWLHFATTAMHAYGYEWGCQLVYNPHDTMGALDSLERGHQCLMEKVEALYASLNIHDRFPELQGVNLDFVRTLLMARDLKINIHKCAIGSFFEWDKLDRAVGGAQQALQTHKAIAKRQPALMTAICKFNSYCERLETLYDPSWGIPLPMALPTKLVDLRNNQTLMEDVWITPSAGDIPRWLDNSDVRGGIRTLLKHDRCQEEHQRLSIEADNLCRYFGDELCALELALSSDANQLFSFLLRTRQDHLLQLQSRWANPFTSMACFSSRAKEAVDLVKTLMRGAAEANPSWINHPLTLEIDHQEDDIPDFEAGPSDVDAHQIAFTDFLEEDSVANEDIEDIAEVGKTSITICWAVPEALQVDEAPVPHKDHSITMQRPGATRIWLSRHGFPRQIFDPRDISFLSSPTAHLNDACLNGCVILLHDAHMSTPTAQRIAILSTHDLPHI
ncbi:uncharacterized protein EDB91DRAFT_1258702 [Suillus paluster]|uniref:uncharacterized protein n=1 Tax=Suillus paluster TaxID=48578 RepID=UPI001B870CD9|nr:uncharacterized protein EDB91DRAFT_1258702 [Suillus paluster]KAG1718271.1 hypothetical protein EDB91DRAFT_1258702 [Suillus paluster]